PAGAATPPAPSAPAAASAPAAQPAPSTPAPATAAEAPAAPAAEEPHRHHHARRTDDTPMLQRPGVIQLVPDRPATQAAPVSPAPAPSTTPAPFGGVKIAPPATQAPSRDLAPGEPGTGDETM